MRLLVKIGGAPLEDAGARHDLAVAVGRARAAGHQVVLVHGGGNQIRNWTTRLGLEDRYHDGLRVTDADTAEVVSAVLCGLVNKELVAELQRCRVAAVGLCGADGGSFSAARHAPGGHDLGYVGEVDEVDATLIGTLLAQGQVPVLATVAPLSARRPGDTSRLYNINADMAAGALAGALGADAVLFLTDVPGVRDTTGRVLPQLTPAESAALGRDGAIRGGMRPKLQAALHALRAAPRALVKIAPAAADDAVLGALDPRVGTLFCVAEHEHHG